MALLYLSVDGVKIRCRTDHVAVKYHPTRPSRPSLVGTLLRMEAPSLWPRQNLLRIRGPMFDEEKVFTLDIRSTSALRNPSISQRVPTFPLGYHQSMQAASRWGSNGSQMLHLRVARCYLALWIQMRPPN